MPAAEVDMAVSAAPQTVVFEKSVPLETALLLRDEATPASMPWERVSGDTAMAASVPLEIELGLREAATPASSGRRNGDGGSENWTGRLCARGNDVTAVI